MGKIEDMRRAREQNFADMQKRGAKAESAVKAPAVKPEAAAADVAEGKCPECGKTKPVKNGVMAQHQKGFGKACAGSRKPAV